MYKKDARDIKNYVNYHTLRKIRALYNKLEYIDDKLLNKIAQVKYLNAHNIPTANFIGELKKGTFIDAQHNINEGSDLIHIKEIVKNILYTKTSVFIKQIGTYGEKGVLKVDLNNFDGQLTKINLKQDYIIEETLKQHEALSEINPYCINTLRVNTYRKDD